MNQHLLPSIFLLFLTAPLSLLNGQGLRDAEGDPVYEATLMPGGPDPGAGWLGQLTTIPAGDEVEGDYIGEMRFTPDGKELWVLHRITNNISVFDWATQSIVQNIEVGMMPMDIAFSNEYAVVPCYSSSEAYIIRLEDYQVAAVVPTAAQPAKARVSRDGSLAVVGCDEPDVAEVIALENLEKQNTISDFPVYLYKFSFITSNPRNSVYYSGFEITPDNNFLVNGAGEEGLRFYDINTGAVVATIPEAGNTGQLALSGDGLRLVAVQAGSDGTAFQADVAGQSLLQQVSLTGMSIYSFYSSPAINFDGSKILVPVGSENTALIDFTTGSYTTVQTGNTPDWVGQSADYQYAIAGDYYLAVIDFETGNIVSSLNGISIQNGAVSPSGNRLAASDPLRYEGVYFYEFEAPGALQQINYQPTGSPLEADVPYSVEFTPDGQRLLVVNALSGTLSVIDVESETLEAILPLGSTEVYQVSITSDSRYALVAKRLENKVAIIDLSQLEVVTEVNSGGSKPDQVFVLPGDAYAYAVNAGSPDRIGVIALDGANSSLESTINIGNTGISWTNYGIRSGLKFTPDGAYAVLAAPFDQAVQFIDLSTHTVVNTLSVEGFPLQLAISEETGLGIFIGVTLKDASAMALIAGAGPNAAVVGSYPCGGNPTRVDYIPGLEQFALTSNDGKSVETFSLEFLSFTDENSYANHTPIAVRYSPAGHQFVVLRSDNTDNFAHWLEVDGFSYALPGLPNHQFGLSPDGEMAAVPLPSLDAVSLLKEATVGWSQKLISLKGDVFRVFPNPVGEKICFQLIDGVELSPPAEILLRNASGQLLFRERLDTPTTAVIQRQTAWPSGLYFYEIRAEGRLLQSGRLMLK